MKDRIKALRKAEGLTQEAFGEKIGLKQNSVAQLESGRNTPSDQTILAICREFHVREEWLRTGDGDKEVPKSKSEEISKFFDSLEPGSFKESFILALTELDEDRWEMISEFIRKVAAESAKKNRSVQPNAELPDREEAHRMLDEEFDAEEKGEEKSYHSRGTA